MTTKPEHKELRAFGLLVGAVFAAIGLWPAAVHGAAPRLWALVLAGGLILLSLAAPWTLKPVHKVWMKVGHVLGFVNTRILLGVIFYVVLTPIGLVRRALGKDTVQKTFVEEADTYRVVKAPRPASHVKHQF